MVIREIQEWVDQIRDILEAFSKTFQHVGEIERRQKVYHDGYMKWRQETVLWRWGLNNFCHFTINLRKYHTQCGKLNLVVM